MRTMTKDQFTGVIHRLRSSGLSVVDFCRNECYVVSTFYYWKRKYGFSASNTDGIASDFGVALAPVSITGGDNRKESHVTDEILVEFPQGVKIYFRGDTSIQPALELITQICSSHVLPQ